MARRYSDVERANLKWFPNDASVASLRTIYLKSGEVRGLKKATINFNYPITAIAGKNGCGKSTIIALAACAFHNEKQAWKLPDRKTSYYTFSEFFVQTFGERPLDGVDIRYQIHYDNWHPSASLPEGKGLGWQFSQKRKGGRWADYDKRVDRPVAFFGIERVVPSVEKSVFRSYRQYFSAVERSGFEEAVCKAVSKVLGVPYEVFEFRSHGKYRLPWVQRKRGAGYSGFNMGAGEKALFEFFAAILSAPRGALFLVDEIELGLHEQAQTALMRVLSELCAERHIQVICTTHSPIILAALPPEGRMYVDTGPSGVSVISGISPAFATGKLSGKNSCELVVYAEDLIAAELIRSAIPWEARSRVSVCPIGSFNAVIGGLAMRFKDPTVGPAIAFLDGDQRVAKKAHVKKFVGLVETQENSEAWIKERLHFLPGDSAPESTVMSRLRDLPVDILESKFQYPGADVVEALDMALLSSDHNELSVFSRAIHQDEAHVWRDCCQLLVEQEPGFFEPIGSVVTAALDT